VFTPHLAGPQGQAVAQAVVTAIAAATGVAQPTPAAVAGLTPDARSALQIQLATIAMQAEQNRLQDAQSARAADLAALQASLSDIQSARTMAETLAGSHSELAYGSVVVSVVIVVAFGATTWTVLSGHVTGQEAGFGLTLVGTLAAMATQVANYWLGSSSGSRGKDLALANSMPMPAALAQSVPAKT
jgi:hypothetical protein